jgi:hypothetical protein
MSAPGSLRSAPAAGRGRRGIRGILRFRGIFWLLGSLGLSSAAAAATSSDTPSDAARLEARIKAARQVLAERSAPATPATANRLAQWLNEPDWRNWGNWPNWFNQ